MSAPTPDPRALFDSCWEGIAHWAASAYKIPGHEPEDIRQIAGLKVWEAALAHRPALGTHENSFRCFAKLYVRRALRNEARKARHRAKVKPAGNMDLFLDEDDPVDYGLIQELFQVAAERLTPPQHEAFVLRFRDGLPRDEAAAKLGISEGSFQDRIKGGLDRLRALFNPGKGK